jgi:hypothetical protein
MLVRACIATIHDEYITPDDSVGIARLFSLTRRSEDS